MRLQRLGAFIFLVGAGAFLVRHFHIEVPIDHAAHVLRLTTIVGLGFGIFLMALGTIVRGASATPPPQHRTDRYRTQWQARPIAFGQAAVPPYRPVCSSCRNPLADGARFCPRCGASTASGSGARVASATQPAPTPQGLLEPMELRGPAPVNRRPGPRFGSFRLMFFIALIVGGGYVAKYWEEHGNAPWEDWNWSCDQCESTKSATRADSRTLPTAPDPRMPVASTPGQAEGASIGQSSVETAVDDDGNVGIRIHASVYSTNTSRYWLGAHLRFSDLGRVYSTDARYRDSNGQAAAMAAVPVSTGLGPVDVTAFIPSSALKLEEGNFSLEALVSLYDISNRLVGTCQVLPFTSYRGEANITRVQMPPLHTVNGLTSPLRTFNVNYTIAHPQAGMTVASVVRFKDEDGRTVPGQSFYAGPFGELRVESKHALAVGGIPLSVTGQILSIPASMIPPRTTAEITVCNSRTGVTISEPVSIKMP